MEIRTKIEVLILLGANMGAVKKTFTHALDELGKIGQILKVSSLYSSPSWGFQASDFQNQAAIIETELSPQELLNSILSIEKHLGRVRVGTGYQSRIIDIDIILIKNKVVNTTALTVPHPKMHERKFVLVPCSEIAAEWNHPLLNKKVDEMLKNCEDSSKITMIE
ncbi:MAG: 2-amino-4-hydroxy-6-hydroxymethyldihydropteridine diphosphokinase [Bacteroidia bacterium]